MARIDGTVTRLSRVSGLGFIRTEAEDDVLFHAAALERQTALEVGALVTFKRIMGETGPEAKAIAYKRTRGR